MDQANNRYGGDPSEGKSVSAANGGVTSPDTGGPSTKKQATAVVYRECLKNHAASIGGHAVDGCCEFMASSADPLKCAACGCHRNFHRREAEGEMFPRPYPLCTCTLPLPPAATAAAAGVHAGGAQVKSASPPTHISSPYNSAPQMLLALSAGGGVAEAEAEARRGSSPPGAASAARRRMRTRFSKEQKERMHSFAEKLGWKLQRQDDAAIQRFCEEIGIRRSVLKVWIHNNKSNFARKDHATNLNS